MRPSQREVVRELPVEDVCGFEVVNQVFFENLCAFQPGQSALAQKVGEDHPKSVAHPTRSL